MDDESEIVRKNIGLYFNNMQELHNMDMIYVQNGRIFKGLGEWKWNGIYVGS